MATPVRFNPRKTPLQARSTASVEAILEATIQVLLGDGQSRLTTTRVAARAGVSVGTLYQYFPNKNSLLQTLLKDHLDAVASAMERACENAHGETLARMAEALITAFVRAKFRDIHASVALYAVSDQLEIKQFGRDMHARSIEAMTAMFESARDTPPQDAPRVAATLLAAMAGVSRATLEGGVTRDTMATLEKELTLLARAYLGASAENTTATPL